MPRETLQLSAESLFRYQLVAEVRARVLEGMPTAQAIRAVRALPHADQRGQPRTPSRRTIYRWLAAFEAGGIAALEPQQRPRTTTSKVLGADLIALLDREKTRDPELSVPDLIMLARDKKVLGAAERVSRTTVWRACRRMGLPLRRSQLAIDADMRRFAYPHRMMMVLSDGKHFRAGATRAKRVALAFLDDATRYGLGILVGTTETTELFLQGIHQVLVTYGLMNALFLDNGAGFISGDTRSVIARLDRRLIYGRSGYPEGHGKIERFNRTFKHKIVRTLDGHPEVDPDLGSLTLRLNHWLTQRYNQTPHEGLDGDTPAQRWLDDERNLTFPPDRTWLDAQFLVTLERRVSRDHVVSVDGAHYEVPTGTPRKVEITRHLLTGRLTIRHDEREIELAPVDLHANAYARRGRPRAPDADRPEDPLAPASQELFDHAYGSILDPDGSYPDQGDDR